MFRLSALVLAVFMLIAPHLVQARSAVIPAPPATPIWTLQQNSSHIRFKGSQMGTAFEGSFKNFTADIMFDPDNLPESSVRVDIITHSADTADKDRDSTLQGKDWLDSKNIPGAVYESTGFKRIDDTHFEVDGTLTIKNIAVPVSFPFTLVITQDADSGKATAVMQASLSLDRTRFQLGQGEWADASAVAHNVDISLAITATRE